MKISRVLLTINRYYKVVPHRFQRLFRIARLKNESFCPCEVNKTVSELFVVSQDNDFAVSDFNHFRILGQDYNLDDVNWSQDIHSAYIYPLLRFDKIHYQNLFNQGIEVKNPWELSRFQFFYKYVQSYAVTRDEKYYQCFKNIVYNWCKENPFLYGVNWSCTMEVAIRALNLVFAASMFDTVFYDDIQFKTFLKDRLTEHARYIHNFPEKALFGNSNNHLTADYCGLFVISLFIDSKESRKWRQESIEGLEECMREQVLADGCDFECSIPYHRLTLEMFLTAALLDAERKWFSQAFYARLFKMFEFVGQYTDVNGNAPQMGDNDSGIILPFNILDNQNHLYLLQLGSYIFESNLLENKWNRHTLRIIPKGQVKINCLHRKFNNITAFEDGGYYVLKYGNFELMVYSPEFPLNRHGHCDRGNFTLSYKGRPVVVDPGSGTYTSDVRLRNLLRSVLSHNVYHNAADKELPSEIFRAFDLKYSSSVVRTYDNGVVIKIQYEANDLLTRDFYITEDEVIVSDNFISDPIGYTGVLNFYDTLSTNENEQIYLSDLRLEIENATDVHITEYPYSPIYGTIVMKQRIEYKPSNCTKISFHAKNL